MIVFGFVLFFASVALMLLAMFGDLSELYFVAAFVGIAISIVSVGIGSYEQTQKNVAACEAKGGIYLEHTYRAGKFDSSEAMGCFKKDALVEIGK